MTLRKGRGLFTPQVDCWPRQASRNWPRGDDQSVGGHPHAWNAEARDEHLQFVALPARNRPSIHPSSGPGHVAKGLVPMVDSRVRGGSSSI